MKLHFVESGSGPLVVLLHGFPEFWYSWRRQMPALASAGFRAVAPDLRGFNDSECLLIKDPTQDNHAIFFDQPGEAGIKKTHNDWRKDIRQHKRCFSERKPVIQDFLNRPHFQRQFVSDFVGIRIFASIDDGTGIYIHTQR